MSLTDRQREVFLFIVDYKTEHGFSPTVRDTMERFGFTSPQGVVCHFKALEKKGLIRRIPGKSRAIKILVT
jgi:repressor LexA